MDKIFIKPSLSYPILTMLNEHLLDIDSNKTDDINYSKIDKYTGVLEASLQLKLNDCIYYMTELLKRGCDINLKNKNEQNLLYLAIYQQKNSIAKFLIDEQIDLYSINMQKQNALQVAVLSGNIEILNLLLEKGMGVDECCEHKIPALLLALDGKTPNHLECAKILLEHGANIFLINEIININVLFTHVALNNATMREYFIEKGVDYFFTSSSQNHTILHYCSDFNYIDTFKFYCEKGVDPYQQDANGNDAFKFFNELNQEMMKKWYGAFKEKKDLEYILNNQTQKNKKIKI